MRQHTIGALAAALCLTAPVSVSAQEATQSDANETTETEAKPDLETEAKSGAEAAAHPAPQGPPPRSPFPMMGPNRELVLSENFLIRPGVMVQSWTELLQDRLRQPDGDAGEFQMNSYIRRARFFVSGLVFGKIAFLLLLEGTDLGLTNAAGEKVFNTLAFRDALLSFNFHPALSLQAGLFLVPFSRNILQSTSTYLSHDILATSATAMVQTQTALLRDTGLQLKGQLLDGHLEYRLAMLQGIRQPSVQMGARGGKNPLRFTGYLQYNFLDTEAGYVFDGYYFGRKRVFGLSAGFDYQKLRGDGVDAYYAFSGAAFTNIPLSGERETGGDELAALVQVLHFEPGTTLQPPPAPGGVAKQTDIGAELAYYNKGIRASIYGKFERRMHSDAAFEAGDLQILGGGLKYFFAEAAANVTLAYNYYDTPNADENVVNSFSQILMQLQLAYH
jgi:hypothetical protein